MSLFTFPRGVLLGAVLTHLFDPRRGRQRRARLKNAGVHWRRETRGLLDAALRDAQHRSRGLANRMRGPSRDRDVDERIVLERVRAALGHVVAHPAALEITMRGDRVLLRGPVLTREADGALKCARRVDGVRGVIDELERHDVADIPSLQGRSRQPDPTLWPPAARGAAVVGGAAIGLWGLIRGGLAGTLGVAGGAALVTRGAMNLSLGRLAGMLTGREQIDVHKTIVVYAPIERVFDLWRRFENFPRIMEHVRNVELAPDDPRRSRWTVDGPAGTQLSFEARTTVLEQPREISWVTLPDQPIEHSGVVRFDPVPDGTRIDIQMSYRPPAGAIGHAVGRMLGWSPKNRLDDDLVRVKSLLEEGHTRAHGERVSEADLVH